MGFCICRPKLADNDEHIFTHDEVKEFDDISLSSCKNAEDLSNCTLDVRLRTAESPRVFSRSSSVTSICKVDMEAAFLITPPYSIRSMVETQVNNLRTN